MRPNRLIWAFCFAMICVLTARPGAQARAQAPADRGQLVVTVVDPSGAVIVGATVGLVGLEAATKSTSVTPMQTTGRGAATFESLVPGRYRLEATFSAFEAGRREIAVRRGENRQSVSLNMKAVSEEMVVGVDPIAALVDPKGGYYMTADEIARLPDDPVNMAIVLMQLAGTNLIHVDGFPSGRLPSKSQIKSIHIVQDAFAAENHAAGVRVDVVTQISAGPKSGGFRYAGNNEDVGANGRVRFEGGGGPSRPVLVTPFGTSEPTFRSTSPFASRVPESRDLWGGGDFAANIVPGKYSFAISGDHEHMYSQPLLNVALPGGIHADVADYRQKYEYYAAGGMFDFADANNRMGRLRYDYYSDLNTGGVGGYALPSLGWSVRDTTQTLRLQEGGPVGARGYLNNRFQLELWRDRYAPDLEAPTVRVLDAFTEGGAQESGQSSSRSYMLASEFDYVRGIHAMRTGYLLNAAHTDRNVNTNYLGTYTFESLADYEAGRPASYTRVTGDPRIAYWHTNFGAYVQDDIKLRKNLILSPGLRYEAQLHVNGANWAPRFGLNWAPGKSARTAIRLSWGLFYDWLPAATYERVLQLGGQQAEINIADPSYPAHPADGPANHYQFSASMLLQRRSVAVVSLNHQIGTKMRAVVGYTRTEGSRLMRGHNLNAPVNGVRPDPARANVIEVASDAGSRQNQANASFTINFAGIAPGPGRAGGAGLPGGSGEGRGAPFKTVDWRRMSFTMSYNYNRPYTNTEGPFWVSPTGTIDSEWGAQVLPNIDNIDLRHSASFSLNSTVVRDLTITLSANRSVGAAYTQLTGADINGDLIFNDRPAGEDRFGLRAPARINVGGGIRYSIRKGMGAGQRPYRVELYANGVNLLNRSNYGGYTGVMPSPFSTSPTRVLNPRVVRFGLSIGY